MTRLPAATYCDDVLSLPSATQSFWFRHTQTYPQLLVLDILCHDLCLPHE